MFFDTYNVCICELESQDSRAHCSHEPPSAAAGHPGREAAGTKQQQQSSSSLKTGAGIAGKQLPCLGSFS